MSEQSGGSFDLREAIDPDSQKILDGLLRKRLYVAFVRPVRTLDEQLAREINALLPKHWEWLLEQEGHGRVFAAGPFVGEDEESYSGDGMFIIQAASLSAARSIVHGDPIVASGLRTAEVRPWELNEGGLTLTVRFSNSGFELA